MKVIYNNIIPFKGFVAMNLFGVLFARKKYKPLSPITINHEAIHSKQIIELGFIGFYILYILEYIMRIIQHGNLHVGYRDISFEREAYAHEKDLDYLNTRKHYSQWRNHEKKYIR